MKIIKEEKLTERNWNTRLKAGAALRRAIAEEDYQGVIDGIRACYKEMLDKGIIDDWDYERWTEDLDMYEPDDEDIEDTLDYELGNLYDACDNLGCWVELDESLKESQLHHSWLASRSGKQWKRAEEEDKKSPGNLDYMRKKLQKAESNSKFEIGDVVRLQWPGFIGEIVDKQFLPYDTTRDPQFRYLVKVIDPESTTLKKGEIDDFAHLAYEMEKVENYDLEGMNESVTEDLDEDKEDTLAEISNAILNDYTYGMTNTGHSWSLDINWDDDIDESLKESASSNDMLNIIYDTLMNNKKFPQFDVSKVEDSELDSDSSTITFDYNGKTYQLTLSELNKSVTEDLDNLESTDNTVVINQPTGAAEEESKKYKKRFEDATKEPKDAPLFGAKEQPKPDEVEEPKAELKESKLTLDEGLFEDNKFQTKRNLKEEVSDLAYQMADEIDERFREQGFISWDDFNEAFEDAYLGLIDWTDDSFNDLETDVRGMLSNMGWETIFEGDDEGSLKLLGESLSEASTLPTGGKDEKFDTDAWSVIYWELSDESEGSADRKMARRAKVNAPMDSRYEHVDPVNDFDLRVYATDESGFDLAKKIAAAWGVKYKIENTNAVHANKFPEEKLQMTLIIPEEMIG